MVSCFLVGIFSCRVVLEMLDLSLVFATAGCFDVCLLSDGHLVGMSVFHREPRSVVVCDFH